jgi:hypothetical protein
MLIISRPSRVACYFTEAKYHQTAAAQHLKKEAIILVNREVAPKIKDII